MEDIYIYHKNNVIDTLIKKGYKIEEVFTSLIINDKVEIGFSDELVANLMQFQGFTERDLYNMVIEQYETCLND